MSKIHITASILEALNKISMAGHGVEIDTEQTGGNSHTNTFITIGCRKTGEAGYTKKMTIKHTSSYSGQFSHWTGVDPDFGELCFTELNKVDELVKKATELA